MRLLSVLTVLIVTPLCFADTWKITRRGNQQTWVVTDTAKTASTPTEQPAVKPSVATVAENPDALQEVNDARKARGLAPLIHDPLLTQAAYACAKERASRGIHGHLPESDFKHLSPTVSTNGVAAGCAAWKDGFGACAMYDNYSHCGAAWVRGADGLKYCHVFCRNENVAQAYNSPTESCINGSCSTATSSRRGKRR